MIEEMWLVITCGLIKLSNAGIQLSFSELNSVESIEFVEDYF